MNKINKKRFLVTLLIVSVITVRISDMILDSRIGALDRTMGFLFGLGRGLIIVVVVAVNVIRAVIKGQKEQAEQQRKQLDFVQKLNKERKARVLEAAGYDVDEVTPPKVDVFFSLWQRLGAIDMMLGLRPMLPAIGDTGLQASIEDWASNFPPATPETFMAALIDRDLLVVKPDGFRTELGRHIDLDALQRRYAAQQETVPA